VIDLFVTGARDLAQVLGPAVARGFTHCDEDVAQEREHTLKRL
jgi:hypothetical protein